MPDDADRPTTSELIRAWLRIALFPPVMAGLLVWPSGDWGWRQAWLVIAVLTGLSAGALVWMIRGHPALLRERLKGSFQRTQSRRDGLIVAGLSVAMLAMFPVAALDHRLALWPGHAVYQTAGWLLFAGSLHILRDVIRTNAFLSRSIVVQETQTVVTDGWYGVVRHPMYLGILLMLAAMAMMLGSVVAQACTALSAVGLYARARSEEALLLRELPGYEDYRRRVRCRMIPFVL